MKFIYDNLVEVYRPTLYSYTETYFKVGSIQGCLMPQKAEDLMLTEGVPAESFKFYCDLHSNIREADKIKFEGGEYVVKTIRKFSFHSLDRIEAFVYKVKN